MSFQGAYHHTNKHRHQHHHGGYRTNGYPSYIMESMPSMVIAAPTHQEVEDRVQEAPRRVRVIEYEYQGPPTRVSSDRCEVYYDNNVDKEAEEFIKLEHRKFGY